MLRLRAWLVGLWVIGVSGCGSSMCSLSDVPLLGRLTARASCPCPCTNPCGTLLAPPMNGSCCGASATPTGPIMVAPYPGNGEPLPPPELAPPRAVPDQPMAQPIPYVPSSRKVNSVQ